MARLVQRSINGILADPPCRDAVRPIAEAAEGESPSKYGADLMRNEVASYACRRLWREYPTAVARQRWRRPPRRARGPDAVDRQEAAPYWLEKSRVIGACHVAKKGPEYVSRLGGRLALDGQGPGVSGAGV